MAEYFRWYPADGGSYIDFGNSSDFILRTFEGTGSTQVSPQTQKAPYQVGETYLNADVSPRVVTMEIRMAADNLTQINDIKNTLSRKLAAEPVVSTEPAPLGTLQYHREGQPTLEIKAVAVNSPQFVQASRKGNVYDADIEFYCPYPYWRETTMKSHTFESSGGLTLATTFPLEIETYDLRVDINNEGDVAVPFMLKVYGEITTFRIIDNTTGEELEVTASIASGERVVVNTAFGEKSVVLIDSTGTETSIFDKVTLTKRDFFKLEKGINDISFETDVNNGGYGVIQWRENFAGV